MFTNMRRALQWLGARRLHTLSEAAMMLLHLLLHVLIFHLLTAKGGQKDAGKTSIQQALREQRTAAKNYEKQHSTAPKDINYVMKYVENCPVKGYYFTRDYSPNTIEPDTCYLCFCQAESNAVCWKRDNTRCNDESFQHNLAESRDTKSSTKKSNDTRIRRSPGFTDIFFRDASRDVFNKNTEDKQCKPYESSFSDDCPPADWCIGCTVCDCDANGRWDCHILSFCSDPKKSKTAGRKMVKKKKVAALPIGARPRTSMPIMGRRVRRRNSLPQKKVVKKSVTQPKMTKHKQQKHKQDKKKLPLRYKRIAQKPKAPKMFKKRNIATRKPIHIHRKRGKNNKNSKGESADVAKQFVKQMMTIVNKLVQKEINNMTKLVAKRQQWIDLQAKKRSRTTLTPRIIGGTRKRRHKREIETALNESNRSREESESYLWQKRYEGQLMSAESSIYNSTVISSTAATNEGKTVESTIFPIQSDIKEHSVSPKTKSKTVVPISANTDLEKDYYKYVVATNIIPLTKNQSNIESLKFGEVSKMSITNTTERTMNRLEAIAVHTKETVTEKENIVAKMLYNERRTELPVTIEKATALVNILNETSNGKIKNNISVDDILVKYLPNPYKYLPEVNPAENDIKFNKWPKVKTSKEIETTTKLQNEIPQTYILNNSVITRNSQSNVRRKDIKRIAVTRKYNLLKTLNYHRCPFLNKVAENENRTYMVDANQKISGMNNTLKGPHERYSTKMPKIKKAFSFVKYLRKLFNYVFKRKNKSDRFNKYHILETLCEHFGPCKIRQKDKYLLRLKLTALNHETIAILKTVKIIKGLLTLLDDSDVINKTSPNKRNLSSAIQKLNSILKGNYGDHNKEPLTETKKIQIEYIKKNTKDFVKSVSKFAILLNEIIAIITQESSNPNQKDIDKYQVGKDPFKNLKSLLMKYNLVQNNFMKKMYDLVNSFENKMYEKPKVSPIQDLNSSLAVENFSRTILKNLRKLKHLEQSLNYNKRPKREINDDNALEYLLMLMEYLLKQNHPLDAVPANDGIDLLIEAIKNAPDINTVRKKVLMDPPSGQYTTMMAISRNILYRSTTETSVGDVESDSETASNEDPEKPKVNTNEEVAKSKGEENKDLFDLVDEDNNKAIFDRMQYDRRAGIIPSLIDFTTNVSFYDEIENITLANSLTAIESTPSPQLVNEEESLDNGTNHLSDNDIGYSDNPNNANNNYDDNTEPVNIFSNTVNNNDDTNTRYANNYDDHTPGSNIYKSNANDQSQNTLANDNYQATIPEDQKNDNIKTTYDSSNAVTDENVPEETGAELSITGQGDSDKKIETVYIGEIEEEETTPGIFSDPETEVTTVKLPEPDNVTGKLVSKEVKTLDSYDSEKIDKKSKLEWIEENFRREYSHYDDDKGKAHEDKRDGIKSYTPVTLTPGRTNPPTSESNKRHRAPDVSLISNEITDMVGKKKKSTINTEDVMFKKQMDLLNSLDYVTEKVEFEETESKDGNAEEKYAETFPAYFV